MSLCPICSKFFQLKWTDIQTFIPEEAASVKTLQAENGDSEDSGSTIVRTGECKRLKLICPHAEAIYLDSASESIPITSESTPTCNPTCCPSVNCVACLGLVEEQYIRYLGQVVTKHFDRISPTGMNTFSLAIHIPLSASVRGMGMLKLSEKLKSESIDLDFAVEGSYVKDELRCRLRKELEKSLCPLKYDWDSAFSICVHLEHASSASTCSEVKKLRPSLFPSHKRRGNFKKHEPIPVTNLPLQKALKELDDEEFESSDYFLSPVSAPCDHRIEFIHRSCFIAGRYNKYSRELPQTPWVVDGVKKAETSVEELICPKIISAFRASDARFSSSGREDVDVLMLGKGRPFLLELVNPMNLSVSDAELGELEREVNASTEQVAVRMLKAVSKESSALLKQGEEEKRKVYSALVWTEEEIEEEAILELDKKSDIVIQQRTPMRVLHRRTLAVRERTIYSLKTERIDGHHFLLRLETQAGTYIKEFVHGDFGRTQPNISTLLGCTADILSLDVLDVHLSWPP